MIKAALEFFLSKDPLAEVLTRAELIELSQQKKQIQELNGLEKDAPSLAQIDRAGNEALEVCKTFIQRAQNLSIYTLQHSFINRVYS